MKDRTPAGTDPPVGGRLWWLTYPLRRLAWMAATPERACNYTGCPRPRVGLSVWCRTHTDRVLAGESIAAWPWVRPANCAPWALPPTDER